MSYNLLEAFHRSATARPDHVFCHFVSGGAYREIRYSEMALRARAFQDMYRRHGLEDGTPVLIVLEHSPDLFASFLGALLARCVPSFMPFPTRKQNAERYWNTHRELFSRIGAGAIVTWPQNAESLRSALEGAKLSILHPKDAVPPATAELELPPRDPSRVAFLQHSSGTTGLKKGVALSYGAVAEHIASLNKALGLTPDDRIASWLPLYHDMGLIACFVLPLTLGIELVMLDPFEWVVRPEQILEVMSHYRCTHTWWPNFAFHHVCRNIDPGARYELGSVKAFINCSEPCKPEAFDLFLRNFASHGVRRDQLQVSYGMAETVFCATQTRLGREVPRLRVDRNELLERGRAVAAKSDAPAFELLSAGTPIDGIELAILDADGRALSEGQVGEVMARGRFLFSGYFRNEVETRRRMKDGWYATGDLAFRRGDDVFVMGRKDDRIIVCGKNFFAHDIESAACSVAGVKGGRAVAIGVFSEAIGSEQVIVIAETEGRDESAWPSLRREIKLSIMDRLNLTPHDVLVVPKGWIAKTTSGKMSRADNYARYRAEVARKEAES